MYETLVFDLAMTRLIAIQRYTDCWRLESLRVLRSSAFVACYIVFDRKRKFCCLSSDIAVRSEVKEAKGYAIVVKVKVKFTPEQPRWGVEV